MLKFRNTNKAFSRGLRLPNVCFYLILILLPVYCQLSESEDDESYSLDVPSLSVLRSGERPNRLTRIRQNLRNQRQFSLIPEPNGPFFGFVYDPKTARRFPIPASVAGSCQLGKEYRIRAVEDFRKYESELQCLFAAGICPSKVPEGPQYGGVLLVLNARHFLLNPLIDFAWRGNMVFKAECHKGDSTPTYIGYHNALGRALIPYTLSIGTLNETLSPGEYEDGKPSALMDLSQDFSKTCPNYPEFVEENKDSLPTRSKTLANIYPFNQAVDVLRIVGRQEDGGFIYLGKTYLRDYFRNDKQIATAAFWYVVNYDKEVSKDFRVGQPLPPLEEGFKYTFPGVVDVILRYLPIDNIISRPFGVLAKLAQEVVNTGRQSYLNFRELVRNFGSLRMNSRRMRNYFRDGRPKRRG